MLECHVLMGTVDFMLRVVAADIEAYERFFFGKLSQLPGVQEINGASDHRSTPHVEGAEMFCLRRGSPDLLPIFRPLIT